MMRHAIISLMLPLTLYASAFAIFSPRRYAITLMLTPRAAAIDDALRHMPSLMLRRHAADAAYITLDAFAAADSCRRHDTPCRFRAEMPLIRCLRFSPLLITPPMLDGAALFHCAAEILMLIAAIITMPPCHAVVTPATPIR